MRVFHLLTALICLANAIALGWACSDILGISINASINQTYFPENEPYFVPPNGWLVATLLGAVSFACLAALFVVKFFRSNGY